jgi:dTMP kinase
LPVEEGLRRAARRSGNAGPDRFEREDLGQHERIRKAFLDIAEEEPNRCIVIDAAKPEALVAEDVWEAVAARLRP